MSETTSRTFRSHAERTALTLLNYWMKKSESRGNVKPLPDFDYEMRQGVARVYVPFESRAQPMKTVVVLWLVNQNYSFQEAGDYLSSVAAWDRALFYEPRKEGESDSHYEDEQRMILWKRNLYPKNLSLLSFEVRWKLVAAKIRQCSKEGHIVSEQALSIGELHDSHVKKQWSGFIPVAGDDFSVCQSYLVEQRL